MKIATWNVNSVRFRLALVTRFLRDEQPDVLCLQETKVEDGLFPAQAYCPRGREECAEIQIVRQNSPAIGCGEIENFGIGRSRLTHRRPVD